MPTKIDPAKLADALKGLLKSLPADGAVKVDEISGTHLKRLRGDIGTALERLLPLSRELDPIKRPPFVFDPTNPEIVGQLIGRTMMEQARHPLGTVAKF